MRCDELTEEISVGEKRREGKKKKGKEKRNPSTKPEDSSVSVGPGEKKRKERKLKEIALETGHSRVWSPIIQANKELLEQGSQLIGHCETYFHLRTLNHSKPTQTVQFHRRIIGVYNLCYWQYPVHETFFSKVKTCQFSQTCRLGRLKRNKQTNKKLSP